MREREWLELAGYRPLLVSAEGRVGAIHPLLREQAVRGRTALEQIADLPDRPEDRALRGTWFEFARAFACGHQVAFPLYATPGTEAFVVGRDRPFSPREMDLARRLWPLLRGLDRQVTALATSRADARAAREVRLTPRQSAVLGLLAEGLTARAIGRRLGIGERTVQKHLEAVYDRLGAHDRLAAVLRARDAGLLDR